MDPAQALPSIGTPAAEFVLDRTFVAGLLVEQHPDLAAIWMLFADPDARQQALAAYGDLSDATLQRARGWAVLFGVMLLDSGLIDNPRNAAIGEHTLQRVAESIEQGA